MFAASVPRERIRPINAAPINPEGDYVLYWMIATRRVAWSFALDHAVDLARELGRPLVIFEALRCGYRWASDRLHRFVIEGMRDNQRRLAGTGAAYFPYLEPGPGMGKGLLAALAGRAAAVVTDRFPCFFLPRMAGAAGAALEVAAVEVDSSGLYPIAATDRVFTTAASFRRHLQHELPPHLAISPRRRPVARLGPGTAQIPAAVRRRWPAADLDPAIDRLIAGLPIDHDVAPAPITGGALAAVRAWRRFRRDGLDRYAGERNQPDSGAQSQLSPYLHFGHLSVQVFAELMEAEGWSPERLAPRPTGSRYSAAELEAAATGDPLWNASQTQLVRDGTIHNYLRMLWGKKILEWSPTPRAALDVMLELNNKYAVDGRDPNSYSGIFWVLGRYDRPWGPERPIFGKVRYMSSESAARKLRVEGYMARYRP